MAGLSKGSSGGGATRGASPWSARWAARFREGRSVTWQIGTGQKTVGTEGLIPGVIDEHLVQTVVKPISSSCSCREAIVRSFSALKYDANRATGRNRGGAKSNNPQPGVGP